MVCKVDVGLRNRLVRFHEINTVRYSREPLTFLYNPLYIDISSIKRIASLCNVLSDCYLVFCSQSQEQEETRIDKKGTETLAKEHNSCLCVGHTLVAVSD